MGTNCAPLVADLFLFCYERDFMKSLTKVKRYDLIDTFNSTSRYLDDLLNIDNIHFEHMVHRIYPTELQLNKANASDTEAAFLDLNLSIYNDIISTKIYDKQHGGKSKGTTCVVDRDVTAYLVVDRVLRIPTEQYGCRYVGYPGFNDVNVIF